MSKNQRLNEVFETARRIYFGDEDRLVFFSDVHRGDNSWADEFARNQIIYSYALQHYFESGFTYVEVGDGDELQKFKHIEVIRVAHVHIYRLLSAYQQENRFYYVFGNHDIQYRNSDQLAKKLKRHNGRFKQREEFLLNDFTAYEGLIFAHRESGVDFFVVHGHQGELLSDQLSWLSQAFLRRLWRPLQLFGFQSPLNVSDNPLKRQLIECQLIDWVNDTGHPLICGHTHEERYPENGGAPYFNTGSCVHPRWITCIEIEEGKISLVRWRVKTRQGGELFVERSIVKGPRKISHFANTVEIVGA